jgi:hypothetical protein
MLESGHSEPVSSSLKKSSMSWSAFSRMRLYGWWSGPIARSKLRILPAAGPFDSREEAQQVWPEQCWVS